MRFIFSITLIFLCGGSLFAIHPLVTDDTGTQGKGHAELEINYENEYDNSFLINRGAGISLIYGLLDPLDMVVNIPYQIGIGNSRANTRSGLSDLTLEFKWLLVSGDVYSFALKPGVSIPSGDKDKDLGSGVPGGSIYAISSITADPLIFHINLGYSRSRFNAEKPDERADIYYASVAAEWEVFDSFRLVFNTGFERNPSPGSDVHPAFALAGAVYSLCENCDIDAGYKRGLNRAQSDYAVLAGLTFRI